MSRSLGPAVPIGNRKYSFHTVDVVGENTLYVMLNMSQGWLGSFDCWSTIAPATPGPTFEDDPVVAIHASHSCTIIRRSRCKGVQLPCPVLGRGI